MTTLLEILREARSRLGRAWDLLVTGEDPAVMAQVRQNYEYAANEVHTWKQRYEKLSAMNDDRARTIATIRAAVSNAP